MIRATAKGEEEGGGPVLRSIGCELINPGPGRIDVRGD